MAVKIRLARIGKKHVPFFRIVAIDSRKKRDGAFIQDLGTYDALNSNVVRLDEEGITDWVSKGAIPTDSVQRIRKQYRKQQSQAAKTEATVEKKAAPKPKAEKKAEPKAVKKAEEPQESAE